MTREHKLALIVGFSLVLVLGVLISDHFSKARNTQIAEDINAPSARQMGAITPGVRTSTEGSTLGSAQTPAPRNDLVKLPGVAYPSSDVARGSLGGSPSIALAETRSRTDPLPFGDQHSDAPGAFAPPPIPTPAPQIPLTRYDVKEGDTLYRIAQKQYGDSKLWEKVRDYNKDKLGSSGTIHIGVTLLLPPKDVLLGKPYIPATPPTQTQPTSPKTDSSKPDAKLAGDFKEYVVKDGDTLVAIARKMLNSGKRYTEIIEANQGTLADPEALTVGMKLRIPAK